LSDSRLNSNSIPSTAPSTFLIGCLMWSRSHPITASAPPPAERLRASGYRCFRWSPEPGPHRQAAYKPACSRWRIAWEASLSAPRRESLGRAEKGSSFKVRGSRGSRCDECRAHARAVVNAQYELCSSSRARIYLLARISLTAASTRGSSGASRRAAW
jgi:hypothetical protein